MKHVTVPAVPQDGQRILEILECAPAKGSIELLYTRRPDAFRSYRMESPDTQVFVVKEGERIIGTAAEVIRELYIGGERKKLCYVCGLKKDIHYDGMVNWGKVFIRNLVRQDIDGYFCSIISDNQDAKRLFEKKRRRTMNMERLQRYTTYIFSSRLRPASAAGDFRFRQAGKSDEEKLLAFLNREGRKKDLFPVMDRLDSFGNLKVTDFYILEDPQGIAAVGALWDQLSYRQYIVKHYRGLMKLARLCNPLLRLLGYIRLPQEDQPIRVPMLSFFTAREDREAFYRTFLSRMVPQIRQNYEMFAVGATACSTANKIFQQMKSIHFDSEIYAIDFILADGSKVPIDPDKLWLECGLL